MKIEKLKHNQKSKKKTRESSKHKLRRERSEVAWHYWHWWEWQSVQLIGFRYLKVLKILRERWRNSHGYLKKIKFLLCNVNMEAYIWRLELRNKEEFPSLPAIYQLLLPHTYHSISFYFFSILPLSRDFAQRSTAKTKFLTFNFIVVSLNVFSLSFFAVYFWMNWLDSCRCVLAWSVHKTNVSKYFEYFSRFFSKTIIPHTSCELVLASTGILLK